jgi:predicted phosphoribosyltransferase
MSTARLLAPCPLFGDRKHAGEVLARELEHHRGSGVVVVGLARGGVVVAAAVAGSLKAPLDVVAVRKVGHPRQPEYAIGAVTPGNGVYVRGHDDLTDEQLTAAVEKSKAKAALLDRRLHAQWEPLDLRGKTVLAVDDGLATGATMIAALRWARAAGATRVVTAIPVAAAESLDLVGSEADEIVCPYAPAFFFAVGAWYRSFDQVDDAEVIRLIDESRRRVRRTVRSRSRKRDVLGGML